LPIKNLYTPLSSPIRAAFPAHLNWNKPQISLFIRIWINPN
jgi:hypothetical protein